jgi:putative transposase
MDNHVHLILLPGSADGLRSTMARTHTRYAQRINRLHRLDGHLFQGRFGSRAMAPAHLVRAVRYVENNPVTAGLVARAEDWPRSSARSHISGQQDGLTDIAAIGQHIDNWQSYLEEGLL